MSDAIALRGIRAWGRHGAYPGERDVPQPFDVEVRLEIDLRTPARTDALDDTLDYDTLTTAIRRIVATRSFALLERLADEIAREVLSDARVTAVSVSVGKPEKLAGATPSVTLRRQR